MQLTKHTIWSRPAKISKNYISYNKTRENTRRLRQMNKYLGVPKYMMVDGKTVQYYEIF